MTVSELNHKAKVLLEYNLNNIILQGELSKITRHSSGHWYFDLKDDEASISCIAFKSINTKADFEPKIGDLLELTGHVSLYENTGKYQFIANSIKKQGIGDLEQRFLKLKKKLESQGLFDPKFKKPIAKYPSNIAIICSISSAALQDMLKLIKHKEYYIANFSIFNALTQGKDAPNSLINALLKADKYDFDLIILARGGGSREDLNCFNDENLARIIFDAKTPIISAIGHEIDYVISDFVADLRAPTPSAAIDMILKDKKDILQYLDLIQDNLKNKINNKLYLLALKLSQALKQFKIYSINKIINEKIKIIKLLKKELNNKIKNKISNCNIMLHNLDQILKQNKAFIKKTKNLVQISLNGQITELKKLNSKDIITLISYDNQKQAKIL